MGRAAKKNSGDAPDTSPESTFNGLMTLGGRQLHIRTAPERVIRHIQQELKVEDGVAQALAKRGHNAESAYTFMNPTLRENLPDPTQFKDMNKAVDRTIEAIMKGEMISVFADYDADGATAGSITINFLRWIGVPAIKYIPDRFTEGYGPNVNAMQELRDNGSSLCLMFDCGTAAIDRIKDGKLIEGPITVAQKIGLDVCIFDHHTPETDLPPAHAIVNPKRLDDPTPHKQPAACGMSLLFVIALNSELRKRGFYRGKDEGPESNKPKEPYIVKLFELAALGTMQDMVELSGVNRLIVQTGLKLLNAPPPTDEDLARLGYTRSEFSKFENPGINALRAVCKLSRDDLAREGRELNEQDMSFQMGPRLNASGRIDRARTSIDLLTMQNGLDALDFAMQTDVNNAERRTIETVIVQEAMPLADEQAAKGHPMIIVADEKWHPGVIGIAASRIKEKHERPVIVIGSWEGSWKGSGRSVKAGDYKVDLGGAVTAAKHAGLLEAGGGHPMACGLSLDIARLEAFREFMHQRIGPQMANMPKVPVMSIDAIIAPDSVNDALIEQQRKMAPYGEGNPEPLYLMPNVRVAFSALTSDSQHITCSFARMDGQVLKGIAFRSASLAHGQALLQSKDQLLHVVGTIGYNYFNGRKYPQFKVIDALRP